MNEITSDELNNAFDTGILDSEEYASIALFYLKGMQESNAQ